MGLEGRGGVRNMGLWFLVRWSALVASRLKESYLSVYFFLACYLRMDSLYKIKMSRRVDKKRR